MLDTFMKFADSGDLGCSTKIDGDRKNREWHRTETIEPYDYDLSTANWGPIHRHDWAGNVERMKTAELLAIRLAAGKGLWLSPEEALRLLHETVMRGKERDAFATRQNSLDSVLEGIRGPTPEDPEDAVEEAYDRLEECRRYVRDRYGSDLTNPQADYLAEAEALRGEQQAWREQQERIYEVAAALARGTSERGRHSQAYDPASESVSVSPQGSKRYKRKKALFTRVRGRSFPRTSR
jgi:hypothetical protein